MQDQSRQNRDRRKDAQDNAFGHHKAEIPAHGITHKAEGEKTGDGCDRTAHNGYKGIINGFCHGCFIVKAAIFIFGVAVPEKDGVVHRDAQLQNRGNGLRDIGNFSKKNIAAEVVHDGDTDADQKEKGRGVGIQQEHHGDQGEEHRNHDIFAFFFFTEGFQIQNQRRKTRNVGIFIADFTNPGHGLQGFFI